MTRAIAIASVAAALAICAALAIRAPSPATRGPVQRLVIADPSDHWSREGFVELVPAVRVPSSTAAAQDVTIWLRLPAEGVITTRWSDARGDWVLELPPGTVADRVEQRGAGPQRRVVDVRGARIDADGRQWLHTFRPEGPGVGAGLFGYEWPRDDPRAHADATARLLAELERRPPATRMPAEERARFLAGVARKNQCTDCHSYARADNATEGEHGLVNRGTDDSGLFTPQTVFKDQVVLERYGRVDPNLDDPALTLTCPDASPVERVKRAGREQAACPGRAVPVARVDHARLDPQRLERICRARRYLYEHLDARGREVFADALTPCPAEIREVE